MSGIDKLLAMTTGYFLVVNNGYGY